MPVAAKPLLWPTWLLLSYHGASPRAATMPCLLRYLVCVPVLLLAAGAACTQQLPSPAQPPSDTAPVIASLRAGQPAAALAAAQHALTIAPGDCRLWSLQAVAQQALHQPAPALASFRHALSLCPASLAALEGAAQLEYAAHDPAGVGHLRAVLAQRPADPVAHAMLAGLLAGAGRCADALPHFAAASSLFPAQPALAGDYGACLLSTRNYAEAATIFTQLEDEQPGSEPTRDLAYAQWKAGRPQAALATLQPLVAAGADEQALALASAIAEDSNDTAQAVKWLRQAILLAPRNLDNYLAFARIAAAHKSFQVGVDVIDAGLGVLPGSAPLYVARGVLRVQLSQTAAALADFDHAHQLDPRLSTAMDAIGVLEEQQHDDAASLALFRRQAAAHPDDALLQFLFAEALSEQGGANLREAATAARRAFALEPAYRPALDLLANLCLRQNDLHGAIDAADKALALDANDTQALFTEIRAKSRLGDTAAISALSKRLAAAQSNAHTTAGAETRYRLTEPPAASQ